MGVVFLEGHLPKKIVILYKTGLSLEAGRQPN
jgi:hypothetical protein